MLSIRASTRLRSYHLKPIRIVIAELSRSTVPISTNEILPLIVALGLDKTLIFSDPPVKAWDTRFSNVFIRPGVINFLKTLKARNVKFLVISHRTGVDGMNAVHAINVACGEQILPDVNDLFKCAIWHSPSRRQDKYLDTYLPYDVDRRRCILIDDRFQYTFQSNLYHSIPAYSFVYDKLDYMMGMTNRILPQVLACVHAWNQSEVCRLHYPRKELTEIFGKKESIQYQRRADDGNIVVKAVDRIKFFPDYGVSLRQMVLAAADAFKKPDPQPEVKFLDEHDDPVGFTLKQFYQPPAINQEIDAFCVKYNTMRGSVVNPAPIDVSLDFEAFFKMSEIPLPYSLTNKAYDNERRPKFSFLCQQYQGSEKLNIYREMVSEFTKNIKIEADKMPSLHQTKEPNQYVSESASVFRQAIMEGSRIDSFYEELVCTGKIVNPDAFVSSLDFLTKTPSEMRVGCPILQYWLGHYSFGYRPEYEGNSGKLIVFNEMKDLMCLSSYGGALTSWPLLFHAKDIETAHSRPLEARVMFNRSPDYVSWLPPLVLGADANERIRRDILGNDAVLSSYASLKRLYRKSDLSNKDKVAATALEGELCKFICAKPAGPERNQVIAYLNVHFFSFGLVHLTEFFLNRNNASMTPFPTERLDTTGWTTRQVYAKMFPYAKLPEFTAVGESNEKTVFAMTYTLMEAMNDNNMYTYHTMNLADAAVFVRETRYHVKYEQCAKFDTSRSWPNKSACNEMSDWCINTLFHNIQSILPKLNQFMEAAQKNWRGVASYPLFDQVPMLNLNEKTILPIYVSYDAELPFEPIVSSYVEKDLNRRIFHSLWCPDMDYYEFCDGVKDFVFSSDSLLNYIQNRAASLGIDNLYIMLYIHLKEKHCGDMFRDRHYQWILSYGDEWSKINNRSIAVVLTELRRVGGNVCVNDWAGSGMDYYDLKRLGWVEKSSSKK